MFKKKKKNPQRPLENIKENPQWNDTKIQKQRQDRDKGKSHKDKIEKEARAKEIRQR